MTSEENGFAWEAAQKDLYNGIDISVPHSARIWNYWLGGKDNFPADQQAGDEYVRIFPGVVDMARYSRLFLARSVRFLAEDRGIRQFLDIGTGLPTVDNTHEVAQRAAPDARIVYVDNDPMVLAHARALLTSTSEGVTAYVDADLHDPDVILAEAAHTLDFTRPVGLMLMGIMGHVVDDAEAQAIIDRLLAGLPSGSYLTLYDGTDTDVALAEAQEGYDDTGAEPYHLRSPERIRRFFDGLELVEPGVVSVSRWRADPENLAPDVDAIGGVARKP